MLRNSNMTCKYKKNKKKKQYKQTKIPKRISLRISRQITCVKRPSELGVNESDTVVLYTFIKYAEVFVR